MPKRKPNTADKIVSVLREKKCAQLNTWSLADLVFNNCMQRKLPGNGGRITALIKAAQSDPRLYHHDGDIGLIEG